MSGSCMSCSVSCSMSCTGCRRMSCSGVRRSRRRMSCCVRCGCGFRGRVRSGGGVSGSGVGIGSVRDAREAFGQLAEVAHTLEVPELGDGLRHTVSTGA